MIRKVKRKVVQKIKQQAKSDALVALELLTV